MPEVTPHVRLSPQSVLSISNPSLSRESWFDDSYVEDLIADAPLQMGAFLTPGKDKFSIRVDMAAWRTQERFDPMFDAGILLYVLAPLLHYSPGFDDAFFGIDYQHNPNVRRSNFSGLLYESALNALETRTPLGHSSLRRIARSMMFAVEPYENSIYDQVATGHYAFGEVAGRVEEGIWCDNQVRVVLGERGSKILPTFETAGDATNWIASDAFNITPRLITHNLDYHAQVLSYILGAAALTDELLK